ncbi:hypothetical protein QJS66_09780 [Kocuria rhizophila]|nr:hypothetical protein QJS66_09780 [Kocuria rhizophila]
MRYTLVGNGPLMNTLRRHRLTTWAWDHLELTGRIPAEVADRLAAAHIFFLPSAQEVSSQQWPAIAAGRPAAVPLSGGRRLLH